MFEGKARVLVSEGERSTSGEDIPGERGRDLPTAASEILRLRLFDASRFPPDPSAEIRGDGGRRGGEAVPKYPVCSAPLVTAELFLLFRMKGNRKMLVGASTGEVEVAGSPRVLVAALRRSCGVRVTGMGTICRRARHIVSEFDAQLA